MTDINTGTYGAKVQSWGGANPRNLLTRIIADNPGATELEIAEEFWRAVQDDEEQLKAIVVGYWIPNNYRSLIGQQASTTPRKTGLTAEIKSQIKSGIRAEAKRILLDVVMPNGKPLRDNTGRECAKVGGWLTKVAGKVKPDQIVGKVLTEAQVRTLFGK